MKPTLNQEIESSQKGIDYVNSLVPDKMMDISNNIPELSRKFRIKEQYGVFRIEEKIIDIPIVIFPFDLVAYIFGGLRKRERWISAYNTPFKTFQEATDYIPKLTPKYHEL